MTAPAPDPADRATDDQLAEDVAVADFDLAADIAHPTELPGDVAFDLGADIGPDNLPPSLRR